MWLLVSWAHCSSLVKSSLADSEHLHDWLKKLTLLIPEVRHGYVSCESEIVRKHLYRFFVCVFVDGGTSGGVQRSL